MCSCKKDQWCQAAREMSADIIAAHGAARRFEAMGAKHTAEAIRKELVKMEADYTAHREAALKGDGEGGNGQTD